MELFLLTTFSGLITGIFVLLPTVAVSLLYKHGKYLPLWLPGLGACSAYIVHMLLELGVTAGFSISISLLLTTVLGVTLHVKILAPFIEKNASLLALLVSIGLIQILHSIMGMYGGGKSQHIDGIINNSILVKYKMLVFSSIDVYAALIFIFVSILLYTFFRNASLGKQLKLILSNRSLARHYLLPVEKLDKIIVALAVLLVSCGSLAYGVKYDLQPNMMMQTGMIAIISCIVVGDRHWALAPMVAVVIGVMTSLSSLHPYTSPLQRGLPYILVISLFVGQTITAKFKTV